MRIACLILLAGCIDGDRPVIGIVDPGVHDPAAGLCLSLDPSSIVFDGTVDPEAREATVVTLSVPETDCVEPHVQVDAYVLDDPMSAFDVQPLGGSVTLTEGETLEAPVSLVATEPGTYEGQLVVEAFGSFGAGTRTVQLFAEIP